MSLAAFPYQAFDYSSLSIREIVISPPNPSRFDAIDVRCEAALNIKARRAIPELLIIMNDNRVTPGRGQRAAFILMTSRRDARAVEMLSNDINK